MRSRPCAKSARFVAEENQSRCGVGNRLIGSLLVATALSSAGMAHAQSLNLQGGVGLIDMPSAEFLPDGRLTSFFSHFGPTTRGGFAFQVFPRTQAVLRYTSIKDRDVVGVSEQDQSLDLKFQLVDETATRPSIAIGFRDFMGSGVQSSEYIVASKTVASDFTITGGLGWGRLGSRASFSNPFGGNRPALPGTTEQFNYENFFRGDDVGIFGGVEWRSPVDGLTLKAEYSSDAYTLEEATGQYEQSSPLNFGAEYTTRSGIRFGGYYMYGGDLGFQVSFTTDPKTAQIKQDLGRAPTPVFSRAANAPRGTGWASQAPVRAKIGEGLSKALASEGIVLQAARFGGDLVQIEIVNTRISRQPKAIGRTMRILSAAMPASVETFEVSLVESGLPVSTTRINRADLEAQVDLPSAGVLAWNAAEIVNADPLRGEDVWQADLFPKTEWSLSPAIPFDLFGDGGDFDIQLRGTASVHLTPGLSANSAFELSLLDGFSDVAGSANGLPPVRSDFAQYQGGARLTRLTGDYVFKLSPQLYARASAGYLERMFAGAGAELLWKDTTSPLAFGVDVNWVKQRDPDAVFGFRDYDVVTGHGSVYWDTGWMGVQAQLDAGRYLAGDWGATVSLSRRFANGWQVGAFVTRTDGSPTGTSEGRFDKGFSLTIPLRWTLPYQTRSRIPISFREYARNDGARLDLANRLYGTVQDAHKSQLRQHWSSYWQ